MCENYTYEHDQLPVNTVENFFSRIESITAPAVEELIEVIGNVKNGTTEIEDFKDNSGQIK